MRTSSTLSLLILGACVGDAPPPQPRDGGAVPGDLPGETTQIAGEIHDHFVPLTLLPSSTLTTDAIQPPLMASGSDDGTYVLERVPVGSRLSVSVSRPGYLPTRNLTTLILDPESTHDLSAVSIADARRQHVTLGRAPAPGTAILIATLEEAAGVPATSLPLAGIALVDGTGAAAPGVLGPFAFGAAGDLDPTATASIASGGRARVAFLDLRPGMFTLRVAFPSGTVTTPVVATAGGAVLVTARGGQPPPTLPDPGFALDVHPRLQTAANGGLGCANCHTLGGSGAALELDGLPELVLQRLQARPGLLDPANPSASSLLVKPLYERAMPDHPNATFLDAGDPDYQLIRRWIANGARP